MLSGFPIIEFDIISKYLPREIRNESLDIDECVEYFKKYYEDIDKHYIQGTFFEPNDFSLDWHGNKARVSIGDSEELEVVLFNRNDSYRILYKCNDNKEYDNQYFDRSMKSLETARKFAEYRVHRHLSGEKNYSNSYI